jgi:hypothetical protein
MRTLSLCGPCQALANIQFEIAVWRIARKIIRMPRHLKLEELTKKLGYGLFLVNYLCAIFAFIGNINESVLDIGDDSLKLCLFVLLRRPVFRIESNVIVGSEIDDALFEFRISNLTWLNRFIVADVAIDHTFPSLTRLNVSYASSDGGGPWDVSDTTTLRVIKDPLLCALAAVAEPAWSPEQVESCRLATVLRISKIEHTDYRLRILISGQDRANGTATTFNVSDARLIVNTHNAAFSIVEMMVLIVLSVSTFSFFLYWTAIYYVSRVNLLPEQRCERELRARMRASEFDWRVRPQVATNDVGIIVHRTAVDSYDIVCTACILARHCKCCWRIVVNRFEDEKLEYVR